MCIAALADHDDLTARAIWQAELALQARDRHQRRLAEIARIGTETRRILSSLPAAAEAFPSRPRADAVAGTPSTQGVAV